MDPALLPNKPARVAIFDGHNADISSGHDIGEGIRARTPWGEIAYRLGGRRGYARVNDSESASAPGSNTIRDLLGNGPVLILLDELAVYIRKASQHEGAEGQFTAFLTSLIKAVEETPNAALIFTLAAGGDEQYASTDAYRDENRRLAELKSVASRKATVLNPTEEGETIQVLKRRLFARCDMSMAKRVVEAYRSVWRRNHDRLPETDHSQIVEEFAASYPLHPDILNTLVSKTSTLENFQRIRGMLRLLGHVVRLLWSNRDEVPRPAAIHLHHFDLGKEEIRSELTTRARQINLVPAIDTDVACDKVNKTSLAQRLDQEHYPGMTPFTTYVARTILMHSLASIKRLKGIYDKNLRYSILSPGVEIGYIDEALTRFKDKSLYLVDDPQKPTQFQEEPNLNQSIQRAEQALENKDLVKEIDTRIKATFRTGVFETRVFPDGPGDVDDSTEKPQLIIPCYSDVSTENPESKPNMVTDIFRHKGFGGIRINQNNLVFLVARTAGIKPMYRSARRYLALAELINPNSISDFADYQKVQIKKLKRKYDRDLNETIIGCYKYLYYPGRIGNLEYYVIDRLMKKGQMLIVESLGSKIRTDNADPDNPESFLDSIGALKNEGVITTRRFREEFYSNPALPILIGDRVFVKGITKGIESGVFVYVKGDLVCGKGDPHCQISIGDDALVYTMEAAKGAGKWPHRIADGPKPPDGTKKPPDGTKKPQLDISAVKTSGRPDEAIQGMLNELRKHNIHRITKMHVTSKDDVIPLLNAIGMIKEAVVEIEDVFGDYKTSVGGVFTFQYEGKLDHTDPTWGFLREQLRNTDIPNMRVKMDIIFEDGVETNWLSTLAKRLRMVKTPIEISGVEGDTAG